MASLKDVCIEGIEEDTNSIRFPKMYLLTRLTHLFLHNLSSQRHVDIDILSLSTITSLRHLSLSSCHNLSGDLSALSNSPMLEVLDLHGYYSICVLPSLDNLQHLHTLDLNDCRSLTVVPGIEALTQLRVLDLSGCNNLSDLSALATFRRIEKLSLDVGPRTWVFEWLPNLTALRFLALFISESLPIHTVHLPSCLHHLEIRLTGYDYGFPVTPYITIEGPSNLQFLDIGKTVQLGDAAHQSLRAISQTTWPHASIPDPFLPLDPFQNLQELSLSLQDSDGFALQNGFPNNLPQSLTALQLRGKVDVCPPLDALTGLCKLQLQISTTQDWPRTALGELLCLRCLVLQRCRSLEEIPDLGSLAMLEVLSISKCPNLRRLPPLGALKNLELLKIDSCKVLYKIPPLGPLKNLKEISLRKLKSLCELPALDGVTSLKWLNVEACGAFVELPRLDGLTALTGICLRGSSKLLGLPPLAELAQLQSLDLYGCVLLREIPPLDGLTRLFWLDLRECKGLRTDGPGSWRRVWATPWQGAHESLQVLYPGEEGEVAVHSCNPPNDWTDVFPSPARRWRSFTLDGSEGMF